MNIDEIKVFLNKLINAGLDEGFEQAEGVFEYNTGMAVNIFEHEVSSFENNVGQSAVFCGKLDKQMGSASTSIIEDASINYLVKEAMDNIKVKDDEDEDFFYCDKDNSNLYYDGYSEASSKNNYDSFKRVGLELESAILASDERIKSVDYLEISYSKDARVSVNTLGLTSVREYDSISVCAEAKCEQDGVVKTGAYLWFGNDIDKFDINTFVDEIKKRTVNKLGADSVESGVYDVILSQEAFVSLFSAYSGSLSAYSIQKKLSLFKDKVNDKVASSKLTVTEYPNYDKALLKFPFDYDGVITCDKDLIRDGVFKTPLHNLKTAYKEGVKPTGNHFSGIEYSNLVLNPGEKSFDELVRSVGNGLYITDLNGLHAGINAISGDFSLFCEGFLIKDGSIVRPVEQITISGNFIDLLMNITHIGSDVVNIPDGAGEFFCPSIVISNMNIAGEA
ncbi:MAG: TldD/PmbA family protein [Clostridia bacterium]|nr:TldD/PmbA family protein [Clostridia bacterium]